MITVKLAYKGGSGSGNWGHEGRPGKEGGSLPKGGAASGAYAMGDNGPKTTTSKPSGTNLALPTISVPVGALPDHQKGDADGKRAYQDWYASLDQKPNLADALSMRRYFADRALEMEGELSQLSAQEREESRKKRAEEEKNKPKVLTPAEKKKQEAAKKKAASDALKAKKKAEAEAKKKARAEESAKKKAASAAASGAKKAESAAAAAAKKKAAEEAKTKKAEEAAAKKDAAAKAKADAIAKKLAEAEAKAQAKLDSQKKVAEAVGLSEQSFSMFQDAINTLKGGGDLEANIAGALVAAGLLTKSGDSYTVPSAAMSLFNAIMSADAIKARAALEKLGNKEIYKIRVRKQTITRYKLG